MLAQFTTTVYSQQAVLHCNMELTKASQEELRKFSVLNKKKKKTDFMESFLLMSLSDSIVLCVNMIF